ncbi:MAG: adenylosuccinate lyase, partial [Ignavibacteria bacterium]|nr:adenylosuccinate lyase [Ignavibacteria bacterium]
VEAGLTREQAYKAVQDNAMQSWKTGGDFRKLLESDPVISSKVKPAQIEDIFDPKKVFKNIDYIFKNTGIK